MDASSASTVTQTATTAAAVTLICGRSASSCTPV